MKISVVVCTFNRDRYIEKCLAHLKDQSSSPDSYEVLIINNNSTDLTEEICLNFISKNHLTNFRYFTESNQGLSFARNRGIAEADGDVISFIDDDAFVNPDYIELARNIFTRENDLVAVGGKVTPVFEEGRPSWMSEYLLPLVAAVDYGEESIPFPKGKFPVGANMLFRKSILISVGGFDTSLGRTGNNLLGSEEKDIFYRISLKNSHILYVPGLQVLHMVPGKRVKEEYIEKQAIGIGVSEKLRVSRLSRFKQLEKAFLELVKVGGSFVLAFYFLLCFKPAKGVFLLKFRFWVLKGYLQ